MSRRTRSNPTGPATSPKDVRNREQYVKDKHALRAKRAKQHVGPHGKKLLAMTITDEQNATTTLDGYKAMCELRRAAYREHVARMTISDDAQTLIDQLEATYGPRVQVWHNVVSWPVAVMIARYGEALEHWPDEFTADDVRRMSEQLPVGLGVGVGAAVHRPMRAVKVLGDHGKSAKGLRALQDANPNTLMLGIDDED